MIYPINGTCVFFGYKTYFVRPGHICVFFGYKTYFVRLGHKCYCSSTILSKVFYLVKYYCRRIPLKFILQGRVNLDLFVLLSTSYIAYLKFIYICIRTYVNYVYRLFTYVCTYMHSYYIIYVYVYTYMYLAVCLCLCVTLL